jgi:hypothetical protein
MPICCLPMQGIRAPQWHVGPQVAWPQQPCLCSVPPSGSGSGETIAILSLLGGKDRCPPQKLLGFPRALAACNAPLVFLCQSHPATRSIPEPCPERRKWNGAQLWTKELKSEDVLNTELRLTFPLLEVGCTSYELGWNLQLGIQPYFVTIIHL